MRRRDEMANEFDDQIRLLLLRDSCVSSCSGENVAMAGHIVAAFDVECARRRIEQPISVEYLRVVLCCEETEQAVEGVRFNTVVHVFLTLHYVAFSRIFFRAPDIETSRSFVAGLLTWDGHFVREGLATPWIWLALTAGLAYHFTPKKWVDVHLRGLFDKIPGLLLGVLFTAFIFGLMKLLEGAPRAFIYFQF